MSSKNLKYLMLVAGFTVGFLSCAGMVYYCLLKFEATLTIGNLIQASATIIVGLLVAVHIQRNTNVERKEKEILIRQMDSLIDVVTEFETHKNGGVLTDITASLKKLSVKSKSVKDFLCYLKYPDEIITHVRLDCHIKKLRKLATETPIKEIEDHISSAQCSSVVRDGIIKIADEKRALLDAEIQKVKICILKAQIYLNRA